MVTPWTLALVGCFVAVGAVVLGGILVSREDRGKLQIDQEIVEIDRELATQRDLVHYSQLKLNFSNT